MPETTKRCSVTMQGLKQCGREIYDDKFCIFHSPKKDKQLFARELRELLSDESLEIFDLTSFVFPEGTSFPETFSKRVVFRSCIFEGKTDLSSTFEKGVDFESAAFQGPAVFDHSIFKERTRFCKTSFEDSASFNGVLFKGDTEFAEAIFKRDASFDNPCFAEKVRFQKTEFGGETIFYDALFQGQAWFIRAIFKGETYFVDIIFKGKTSFANASFEDTLLISAELQKAFHDQVNFTYVTFLKPEKVQFYKLNLSEVRFLETDVRKVHFTDVEWNKENGKGRNKVFDEISPASKPWNPDVKIFDYALIVQLYRRLRANYEENFRYSEAGDFYIGEMEMTRKAQTSIFKKLPLLFYKAISNYGESYYRPLGWIAAILLIFPLLFMFAGIQPVSLDPNNPIGEVIHYRLDFSSTTSFLPSKEKISDYYTSFLYSMSVFSFIRDKKYTTIDNWGQTLFVLESILSPVTLAFFLLALRRRFKR